MKYKNLVVCGGGSKAFSIIGCIKSLERNNLLSSIDNFIGCSSGNFPILFLILNFDIIKSFGICIQFYKQILENENTVINIINHCGLIQGKNLINTIDSIIEHQTGIKNITFKQFYEVTKKKMTCVVTNMDTLKVNYLNYQNYPNFIVSEAIRASCSLPLIMTPCYFLKVYLCSSKELIKKKNKKEDIFYLSKMSTYFIGKQENKIIITKDKNKVDKVEFIIYYLKKWIIVGLSKESKNKINHQPFLRQSVPLKVGDCLSFDNQTYLTILDELVYSDGAIIENYSIHLSKKLKGPTLGLYFDSKTKITKRDNTNILYYLKNIVMGMCNEIEVIKIKGFKKKSIIIKLPNDINAMDLELNSNNLKKIIRIGFLTTQKFLKREKRKKKKKTNKT